MIAPVSAMDPAAPSLELLLPSGPVPLGFVREGEVVYLVGRDRSARWPTEVLREGTARLGLSGGSVSGAVELIVDPADRDRVLARFLAKYGAERFERWYGHPARVLRVRLGAPGPDGESRERYYGWLAAEFDNVADDYDRHILGNRINRLLRDRSIAVLERRFSGARHLLEIGCGSGMETLPLLRGGHEVYCVDLSERMLEVVRAKARRDGLLERLRTERLTAGRVGALLDRLGPGAFDGAYSTYGALNCEADLGPIPPALYGLLRRDGRFVAGVYNRWCAFELAGYGLTGRVGRALGRAGRPVRVGSSRFCVDIFAYSPGSFYRIFRRWFAEEERLGVPVLLPPSDLVGYAEKLGRRFDRLDRWDRSLGRRWPFHSLGDHFLMVLGRRGAPTGLAPP